MPAVSAEPPEAPKAAAPLPSSAPKPSTKPRQPPLAPLERKLKQRVARGQRAIDASIDLHGMRQAEAHGALLSFIHRAHRQGAAIVLVVTGKGDPDIGAIASDRERGVLRRLVPHWLSDPSIRRCVLGFEEAQRGHGGSGALYVRIRRLREPDEPRC
jgi:DNA-nicking Smr family endonuclease